MVFLCDGCGSTFTRKFSLKRHQKGRCKKEQSQDVNEEPTEKQEHDEEPTKKSDTITVYITIIN